MGSIRDSGPLARGISKPLVTCRVSRRVRAAAAAVAALLPAIALVAAAPAGAQTRGATVLDQAGLAPHGAAIGNGELIVAWRRVASGENDTFQVCRVPAGQGSCAATPVELERPMTPALAPLLPEPVPLDSSRPWVTVSGNTVRVFGRATNIFMWTSTNGGQSFGPPSVIHDPNPDVDPAEHNPPLLVDSSAIFSGGPPHVVAQAPTGGGESTTYATIPPGSPDAEGRNADIDRDPASGALFTAAAANAGTFAGQVYFSMHAAGDVNDSSTWTSAAAVDSGEEPALAGGPAGLFLLYRAPSADSLHQLLARRWQGSAWGAPNPLAGPSGFVHPDLAQTPSGILVAAFGPPPGGSDANVYVSFSLGGEAWSTPAAVAQQAGGTFERMRAVPTTDTDGFLLWDNGGQSVSLTPYTLAASSDETAPDLVVVGPKRQKFDRNVELEARCMDEECTIGAEGELRMRLVKPDGTSIGATRRVDLRAAKPKVADAGATVTLRLRVPRFIRGAVERAFEHGKPVRAVIIAGAVDAAQNLDVARLRTRLTER